MKKKLHNRVHRKEQSNIARLILIVVVFVFLIFMTSRSTAPLTALPVPTHIVQLSYSGPLTLTSVSTSVLGAQTIDPVDFVNDINKERAKAGAPPLTLNTVLMKAAKMRANVILKYQNFSHQDPHEGIELGTVLPKLNYHFSYASENIGMGGVSASDFVNGFMASTFHRENLLDPRLTETGAAIVDGPYDRYYVNIAVELFAVPAGQDEYLGYSATDKTKYEEEQLILTDRLDPVRQIIQKLLRNPQYSDAEIKKYTRQKQILDKVLARMRNNEPLQNPDVALILEYNTLL